MRIQSLIGLGLGVFYAAVAIACGDSGSSTGDGPECTVDTDCTGTPCAKAVCNQNACETVPVAEGTVLGTQQVGNCVRIVCDGQGSTKDVEDANDVPSNMGECNTGACDGTMATQTPKAAGTACTNGGTVCDGAGTCVECLGGTDCASGLCNADHTCAPASCTNQVKDGDETDVDCGGACPPCIDGKACALPADCESGVCTGDVCQVPACDDGVSNGDETGVDCGGPTCTGDCDLGEPCAAASDCASGFCTGNVCAQVNGCDLTNATDLTAMATVTITQSGLTYDPKCIRVAVGTVITVNSTFSSHPFVGGEVINNAKVPASSGPFVPVTNTGTTKNFTMTTAGTFPYYCDVHALSGMTGAVFVE